MCMTSCIPDTAHLCPYELRFCLDLLSADVVCPRMHKLECEGVRSAGGSGAKKVAFIYGYSSGSQVKAVENYSHPIILIIRCGKVLGGFESLGEMSSAGNLEVPSSFPAISLSTSTLDLPQK